MTPIAKTLIAATALATLTLTPTFADSSSNSQQQNDGGSQIINGQVNLNSAVSVVRTTVDSVGQDVNVTSGASGNALDVTTMNDTHVTTEQYSAGGDIDSDLGAQVTNVGGSVNIQGQVACNSASISTDPNITQIASNQECDAPDPYSNVNVTASGVGGDVNISNTAVANTFEADSNATNMPVVNDQINHSSVTATTTANVSNVAGTVNVSANAVGNSAEVIHYSTN
jgi:hypothetical protein